MIPITGRASSFFEIFNSNLNPSQIQIISNPFFTFPSSSVSRINLSFVIATIFSSLAVLSLSISMANLSRLVATIFSSHDFLSSSISMANLSRLVAASFSSLSFLSNLFSTPLFNLLRVDRRCFSLSSIADDLFFFSCSFLVLLLALSFSRPILCLSYLCSSVS